MKVRVWIGPSGSAGLIVGPSFRLVEVVKADVAESAPQRRDGRESLRRRARRVVAEAGRSSTFTVTSPLPVPSESVWTSAAASQTVMPVGVRAEGAQHGRVEVLPVEHLSVDHDRDQFAIV